MTINEYKPAKRPFKNMREAARDVYYGGDSEKFYRKFDLVKNWPCVKCSGRGYEHEWTGIGGDYNDSDCNSCSNTGIINKDTFQIWYRDAVAAYNKRLNHYRWLKSEANRIKKKLTKDEIKFIKQFSL